ncbi:small integral membrane protein 24 [Chanos chanos]|uniref:Small integral membrane protein 24 n=1 Tax=Chanos chanos TaxID=29144 RepID=A0A6J2WA25_CHACN|nr:small integral membrane protein 24 [Chanos chanos]
MSPLRHVFACLLLSASLCQAAAGGQRATTAKGGVLQPWLVGLAAVVGFLFIVFVLLIVKRLFFTKERSREEEKEEEKDEERRLEEKMRKMEDVEDSLQTSF